MHSHMHLTSFANASRFLKINAKASCFRLYQDISFPTTCRLHSCSSPSRKLAKRSTSTFKDKQPVHGRVYVQGSELHNARGIGPKKDLAYQIQVTTSLREYSTRASENAANGPRSTTESVRRLMRQVPHPVAIITASDNRNSSGEASKAWKGATVSSFNTVTLEPEPVVSFNIKRVSSTFDAIQHSGEFKVTILSYGEESTRLASKFAMGNMFSPFHDEKGHIESYMADSENGDAGMPLFRKRGDSGQDLIQFEFRCKYLEDKTVDISDHVVVFGSVSDISEATEDRNVSLKSGSTTLVYVDGQYGTIDDS